MLPLCLTGFNREFHSTLATSLCNVAMLGCVYQMRHDVILEFYAAAQRVTDVTDCGMTTVTSQRRGACLEICLAVDSGAQLRTIAAECEGCPAGKKKG